MDMHVDSREGVRIVSVEQHTTVGHPVQVVHHTQNGHHVHAPVVHTSVVHHTAGGHQALAGGHHAPGGTHHGAVDPSGVKKLRLRIDTDDPLFPSLRKLKVRGKDLNALPPELFHLTELEVLDLSPEREACIDYHLSSLPRAIGNLVNLRVLVLDTNQLAAVPAELGQLVQLERLSLSNNQLRALPPSLGRLTRLESLHAANNKLDQFPPIICDMSSLRFLDLSDNLLSELPPGVSRLHNLESLILVYNRLERLPDSICDMVNLHVLWLGNNRLKRLPQGFGRLRNLDWGFRHTSSSVVDGNPLSHPPIEVCKRGVDAIARYFSSSPTP